jgi:hypothetical protein
VTPIKVRAIDFPANFTFVDQISSIFIERNRVKKVPAHLVLLQCPLLHSVLVNNTRSYFTLF